MDTSPPLFSTFTLITEIFVTIGVFYMFYQGYRKNRFPTKVAFLTLFYEIFFNISYMTYRAFVHEVKIPKHEHTPFHLGLAIFHGTFSLVMFVALIALVLVAWRQYKKGENFFKKHAVLTFSFIVLWFIAITSGFFFYFVAYFTEL